MERALMYPNGPSSCQHNKQGMTAPAICSESHCNPEVIQGTFLASGDHGKP